ncbi:MAG TPA: LPS assembly protein LptD [Terriglobia bacterium]|nr:LPS assembly protein LptD [Terriglobia bacterium]
MQRFNIVHFFRSLVQEFGVLWPGLFSRRAPLLLGLALTSMLAPLAWAQQDALAPCSALPIITVLNSEFFPTPQTQQAPSIPLQFQNLKSTVTVRSDSRELTREIYYLHGHVEVTYLQFKLESDNAIYYRNTNEIIATGHVKFTDPLAHLEADEAHYNVETGKGWFSNGHGFFHTAARPRPHVVLSPNPFFVQAQRVDRLDENTYTVEHGRLSSCRPEEKNWSLSADRARVAVNDKIVTHGALFRLMNVPLLYLPVIVTSIAPRPRQTGFLLPHIGNSTQYGFIAGDGFFWAINPSADLLLGVEDYSARGLTRSAQFRLKPSPSSDLTVDYFGINDRGFEFPGGQRLQASGDSLRATGESENVGLGFRGVLDVDMVPSLAFRQTWSSTFIQAVSAEARQTGFLTKNFDAYSIDVYASRYQNFLCTAGVLVTNGVKTNIVCPPALGSGGAAGNSITIRELPSLSISRMEKQVGESPFYFSFDASADGVGRTEPGFSTGTIADRFDIHPELSARIKPFWGFNFTPSFGFDATRYGTSLRPGQTPITRIMGDFSADLRPPSIEKIFSRKIWGYKLKHVVVPDIRYGLVRASDREDIDSIVRFDQIDLLSETNEIEFSVTNSLMARKDSPDASGQMPQARDLISLRLSQKYYFDPTFGGALLPGQRVVWDPTISLTGFAFAQGRRLSPLVTVLKVAPSPTYNMELRADFNPNGGGVLNAGITGTAHHGPLGVSLTDFYINRTAALLTPLPPTTTLSQLSSYHLLQTVATFGNLNRKGFSGAYGIYYNLAQGSALQTVGQATYNFGCFGIDFEYRRFALGALRQDNSYRVALSLSNVGTFGNLRTRERLY